MTVVSTEARAGTPATSQGGASLADSSQISLVDILDRLLGTGVVLAGDVLISLSGVDLVQVRLHALITSVRAEMPLPRHLREDLIPGDPW